MPLEREEEIEEHLPKVPARATAEQRAQFETMLAEVERTLNNVHRLACETGHLHDSIAYYIDELRGQVEWLVGKVAEL